MINELKQGIAKEIKKIYADKPIYFNSTIQGVRLPCFYIFLIDKPQTRGLNKRRYYEIQFDIVYLMEDMKDTNESELIAISDNLDNIDYINYLVKNEESGEYESKSIVNIIEAKTELIGTNELHYKIKCRLDYILQDESEVVLDTEYDLKGE